MGSGRQSSVTIRRTVTPTGMSCALIEKEEKTEMSVQNYNDALNLAMDDLVKKWFEYRRRYEEWLK